MGFFDKAKSFFSNIKNKVSDFFEEPDTSVISDKKFEPLKMSSNDFDILSNSANTIKSKNNVFDKFDTYKNGLRH